MLVWFLLALGSAFTNSLIQVTSKWVVAISRYSKFTITFFASLAGSLILFSVSVLIIGIPEIDSRFWVAMIITGVINAISFPMLFRAYEVGEFSSVYSMILLTPVFLVATSFVFLGETPSLFGVGGILLTVLGLRMITRKNSNKSAVPDFKKGNMLGMGVAFLWSISVNFDKLATVYSDRFFAPASVLAAVAIGTAIYLLIRHGKLLVTKKPTSDNKEVINSKKLFIGFGGLLLLGVVMATGNVLHNSALLAGLASYTIAIKRLGVLMGIVWGWLFFKEKDISKKFLGAAIAISGVLAILFS